MQQVGSPFWYPHLEEWVETRDIVQHLSVHSMAPHSQQGISVPKYRQRRVGKPEANHGVPSYHLIMIPKLGCVWVLILTGLAGLLRCLFQVGLLRVDPSVSLCSFCLDVIATLRFSF